MARGQFFPLSGLLATWCDSQYYESKVKLEALAWSLCCMWMYAPRISFGIADIIEVEKR